MRCHFLSKIQITVTILIHRIASGIIEFLKKNSIKRFDYKHLYKKNQNLVQRE